VFSVVVSSALTAAETVLKRSKRVGYYHMFKELREELLLLGIVSLFLSVLQGSLSSVCIECDDASDPFCSDAALYQHKSSYGDSYGDSYSGKALLAAEGSGSSCPPGQTQMFT